MVLWTFKLGSEPCVPNFEKGPLIRPGAAGAKEPSNSPEELLEVTLLVLCGDPKMFTVIFYIVFMLKYNDIMI